VLGHLRSIVGLVWRSVVLWMLLLALLSLANLSAERAYARASQRLRSSSKISP
jgi:hypothetical protein